VVASGPVATAGAATEAAVALPEPITCYRCGAAVAPDRLDIEGWAAIHAAEDDWTLFVCPECQFEHEREAVALLLLFD
jgi:hypothetical protein